MNYYRFTEHELGMIADPRKDAARAQSFSAFALGLVITIIGNFSFGQPDSDTVKGAWLTLGMVSFVAALYYWTEARRLRSLSNERLQAIKDEHDFT